MENKRDELLLQIKNEVINLKESPLYRYRIENKVFPVIGEGNHEAKVMFVGEAPGRNEAAAGRPFCGAAGQILTEMIESIGLKRQDVYITNIVKDRPPDNRDPLPEEIKIYAPFLDRQIEIIKPKIIATLGRHSMSYVISRLFQNRGSSIASLSGQNNPDSPYDNKGNLKTISQIHGKIFNIKALHDNPSNLSGQAVKIITLYHPAVALYQNSLKEQMFKDFQVIKNILE